MTLERCKDRMDHLLHACQSEIICETKMATATDEATKQVAYVNLVGARQERDSLLKKWGLYPVIT